MNAREGLEQALERLTPERWVNRVPGANETCLVMALPLALVGGEEGSVAWRALEDAVRALFPDRLSRLPEFNDHPDTTLEDVRLVVKHALAEVSDEDA